MNAPYKSPHVDDVKIRWKKGKTTFNIPSYGPVHIKMLANYEAVRKGCYFTQRNADSFAWFAMAKYIEQEVKLYPSNPVITRKPSKAPTRGDGKAFSVSDNLDAEADTNDQSHTDHTNKDHQVPTCEDHPVQGTATFGASTVNNDAKTYCDTSSLSGIHYNEFYSQGENVDNPNTYDYFCKGIDGTIDGYYYADSNGNKVPDPVPASQIHRRTPPVSATDQSISAFTVQLT